MIVFSLLLIVVAVALLVLGLAGGSSALLISSIVASLLAAVALVIGARQAAVRRRGAAPAGVPASPSDDPFFADAPGLDEFAGEPPPVNARVGARSGAASARYADAPSGTAAATSSSTSSSTSSASAGAESVAAASAGAESVAAGGPPPRPRSQAGDSAGDRREMNSDFSRSGVISDRPDASDPPATGRRDIEPEEAASYRAEPDYDHASSVIGAARSPGKSESWRRDPTADAPPPAEEFGEPDEDDPADEPLPQAVHPGDAVRVARMDAEVLVVDGRPRYHVAECPHLVGRLTEPLPANEAVELGFSPCGLCRPVDRLVAEAANH